MESMMDLAFDESEDENEVGMDVAEIKLNPFVCGFCSAGMREAPASATFFSVELLFNHLRICHQQGLKPFKCRLCPDFRCAVKTIARAHGVNNHDGKVSFEMDNSSATKYSRIMTLVMAYSSIGMREESTSERFRKFLHSCKMPPTVKSRSSNGFRVCQKCLMLSGCNIGKMEYETKEGREHHAAIHWRQAKKSFQQRTVAASLTSVAEETPSPDRFQITRECFPEH